MIRPLLALAALLLLAACGPMGPSGSDVTVSRYAEPGAGSVNTWILAAEDGVVVIDAQRVVSSGRAAADLVAAIDAPLRAILITHPHPDHFGGLAAFLDAFPDTPVYASEATLKAMQTDSQGFIPATRAAKPDDTPAVVALPTDTFVHEETLTFGSIRLVVDEIGPGASETMTLFHAPDQNALFVGDLVANRMTGLLLEGRSGAWVAQLNQVLRDYDELEPTIYPGHGASGRFTETLRAQKAWLTDLRRLIRARLSDGRLSDREARQVLEEFTALYPDHPIVAEIPDLPMMNIRAVAAELLAE